MSSFDRMMTGLIAFAGGIATGILLAPSSGSETREKIGQQAQAQLGKMERRMKELEKQIEHMAESVKDSSASVLGEVKEAAASQTLPDVPSDPEAFQVGEDEVAGDLRHLPRK